MAAGKERKARGTPLLTPHLSGTARPLDGTAAGRDVSVFTLFIPLRFLDCYQNTELNEKSRKISHSILPSEQENYS